MDFGELFSSLLDARQDDGRVTDEMLDIILNKEKYEKELTRLYLEEMFGEYNLLVDKIKSVPCKVLRNGEGLHKIIWEV